MKNCILILAMSLSSLAQAASVDCQITRTTDFNTANGITVPLTVVNEGAFLTIMSAKNGEATAVVKVHKASLESGLPAGSNLAMALGDIQTTVPMNMDRDGRAELTLIKGFDARKGVSSESNGEQYSLTCKKN